MFLIYFRIYMYQIKLNFIFRPTLLTITPTSAKCQQVICIVQILKRDICKKMFAFEEVLAFL